MKKEDILAKSRHENKNGDEREGQVALLAGAISRVWGLVVCAAFSVVGLIMDIPILTDTAIVYISVSHLAESMVKAIKLKRRLDIAMAIISAIAFICSAVAIVLHIIEWVAGA